MPKKQQHKAVTVAAIQARGHDVVAKEWVRIPQWADNPEDPEQGWVCVWAKCQPEDLSIAGEIRAALAAGEGSPDQLSKAKARQRIATVITCTHNGDTPDAPHVFGTIHFGMLEAQPTAVIDTIVNAVEALDYVPTSEQEKVADFFAILPDLVACLSDIGSACGCCTDCRRNSLPACPKVRLELLGLQIGSSPNTKTDTSATDAPTSNDTDNAA